MDFSHLRALFDKENRPVGLGSIIANTNQRRRNMINTEGLLYRELVRRNTVKMLGSGVALIYIKRHLIHDVTSPIGFDEIHESGGFVRRPELCLAVPDHNIPTVGTPDSIADVYSRIQVEALTANTKRWGIEMYPMGNRRQGIVHIVGPETGFTLPGTSLICGDSHTGTHGAFATLAFGVGTSEVRHGMETTTLPHPLLKTRHIVLKGKMRADAAAKDAIIHIIRQLGAGGGKGYAYEYSGEAISAMSMSERMTICNMTIEGGARIGLMGVDQTTLNWVSRTPKFTALSKSVQQDALAFFQTLRSAPDARFDDVVVIDASLVEPMVTWGTSPDQSVPISDGRIPFLVELPLKSHPDAIKSLEYMGLEEGMPISNIPISHVFIGSCTNGRREDFHKVRDVVQGKKVASHITAWAVPGSGIVAEQLEADGTFGVLRAAGFHVRNPGCSACLAMNDDKIPAGRHCVSTSNRNFENRQGPGARTHLVSPVVAAKTAIHGFITTQNN